MLGTSYNIEIPIAKMPESARKPISLWQAFKTFTTAITARILAASFLLAFAAKLIVGGWSLWDGAVVLGIVLAWPVQEWLIHVCILHWKPRKLFGYIVDPLPAQKHRAHHRDPWDPELVFIPYQVLPWTLPLLVVLWSVAMPTWGLSLTGLSFYLLMALQYEWVHYLVHTSYKPRTRYFRRLWENHRLHHFKNENFWYGVSMLEGDRILGTQRAKADAETSPTCRTLGIEATSS